MDPVSKKMFAYVPGDPEHKRIGPEPSSESMYHGSLAYFIVTGFYRYRHLFGLVTNSACC